MLTKTVLNQAEPDPTLLEDALAEEHGTCYLQQLESLRGEMSTTMLAISGNSLRVLEESLWRQEVLCVSLTRLLQVLQRTTLNSSAMSRIHSATAALHQLNQTYADLVHQSGNSSGLMYTLCRSYTDATFAGVPASTVIRYSLEA